jgi:hypothetical protein
MTLTVSFDEQGLLEVTLSATDEAERQRLHSLWRALETDVHRLGETVKAVAHRQETEPVVSE